MSLDCLPQLTPDVAERSLQRYVSPAGTPSPPSFPSRTEPAAYFFGCAEADIAPSDYVTRLRRYANCSEAAYLHALTLLRRLAQKDERLAITPYNMHRLLITAVMISAKFLDNAWYSASYYAKVGGIATVAEMNQLELAMLKLLDFRVFVTREEIANLCNDENSDDTSL